MAYDFSGSSQTLENSSSSPISSYPFTVALRFNPDDASASPDQLIWVSFDGSGSSLIYVGLTSDYAVILVTPNGGASTEYAISAGTYTQNAWNTVVGYMTNADNRGISLNGATYDTDTGTMNFPSGAGDEEEIGGVLTSSNNFDGSVADIGVWSATLTQGEADAYSAGMSPLSIRPDALEMYRPMVRDTRDLIRQNTLTANGSPSVIEHPQVIYPSNNILAFPPPAAVGGLSIPVASYHYQNHMGNK